METVEKNQKIRTDILTDESHLATWIEAFLMDRKARGLAGGTIRFYINHLVKFQEWCESLLIDFITQITANDIREFMLHLERAGHNEGGRHAYYRSIRSFLYWWENEVEPENWKNPIRKLKAPKVPARVLEPVEKSVIHAMLDTCSKRTFYGTRDRALIMALLDTGARAAELMAMNRDDLDVMGAVTIQRGKGGKPRTVFFGKKTRQAVRAYLRRRNDDLPALWVTKQPSRLTYWGLRQIIRRRALKAGQEAPGLHDFRRFFALECLRSGMDIFTLQRLMGHSDLQVLRRYLAQNSDDLQEAHRRLSPGDNLNNERR